MSTSRGSSPEHKGTHEEKSETLTRDLTFAPTREVPSIESGINKPLPPFSSASNESDRSRPQPQEYHAPSATPLSLSRRLSNLDIHSNGLPSATALGSSPPIQSGHTSKQMQQLIIRSYAPRVAIFASEDTEEFIRAKGFEDGLCSLIRPYGELLRGKVMIRDSLGGSKAWDDFGVRFIRSQQLRHFGPYHSISKAVDPAARAQADGSQQTSGEGHPPQATDPRLLIDEILAHVLKTEDEDKDMHESGYFSHGHESDQPQIASSLYSTYLRKLLSSANLVPYETFCHPVTCVIAVSSHHPAPIEALRQLYAKTSRSNNQVPVWVGTEFLRYYVLIHDEGIDDITKSTALFDLMKRHFGLHCHLLRLKSDECVQSDDDSSKVPSCDWLSPEEEVERIRQQEHGGEYESAGKFIFESDATAIRMFVREMVTQSILPFMENRMMAWNDQVASRRRGISGRFMSLSKRWTGFGSAKNVTSGSGSAAGSSGSNYNINEGFYSAEAPEAMMRQLADYAFMLRDWKLAHSTYDFLRSDFSHDKAWAYHAAANEMVAITTLLSAQVPNSRSRLEGIDQMLENAAYSYLTRCSMPTNVARCLTLCMELHKVRGPVATDNAARWGGRVLELGVLTLFGQTLTTERLADCYASGGNMEMRNSGPRRRQAIFWNVLASNCWMKLDEFRQASSRRQLAGEMYATDDQLDRIPPFASMQPLWRQLDRALGAAAANESADLIDSDNAQSPDRFTSQESEQLNSTGIPVHAVSVDAEGFTTQDAQHPEARLSND